MRILNRPMFRYGGPIKEGIMHGMKNGGRAALVGNPVYPKTDGREHHGYNFLVQGGLRALPWLQRMGSRILPKVKRMFGTTAPATVTKGGARVPEAVGSYTPVTFNPAKFNPNWLGRDPLVQSVGWAGKALTNPAAKGFGKGVVRFAGAPSTLIGGLWFANGRWFNKKGDELDPNSTEVTKAIAKAGGPPGGGDKGMMGTGEWFEAEEQKKLAAKNKADRKAKLEKYLDTMGYDKAKKTAMGDALIDASAIVQDATTEAGSLKDADWGKMINKAIQTTSKRLDKPEQIREAVGLMMTKADIEKDATAETDALNKLLKTTQIAGLQKSLAGNTLKEDIREGWKKSEKVPTGSKLAGLARAHDIEITKIFDATEIPEGISALDYITTEVTKAQKEGTPIPPGNYVIKDRLIQIDETGTITPIV